MEGGVHRGRWNRKATAGTMLLLMCMIIPTLTSLQSSKEKCPLGDFLTDENICCNKCPQGFKLVEKCHAVGQRSNCTHCPEGQYTDQMNFFPNCRRCRSCKFSRHEEVDSLCQSSQNTICRCVVGYFKFIIDSETYECRKCSQCRPDEKLIHSCTRETNTVCECTENYYKVNGKCELCKNCTTECKHHCLPRSTVSTKAPKAENPYLVNIIAGTAGVALVSVLLVIIITYTATKRSTKKKFMKLSSQTSHTSTDPCEVLIHTEEPVTNTSVKATAESPVSEPEQLSKLPDCVPLEIKIPDLIYTLLDLVPVLQVKRLVRSLGVNDTEIEQAELDYRSCREAHYQMLRMWAERGSRAGGGGRGGMLHQPLLQELMDELRNMHLGRAAEELETKYSIQ